MEVHGNTCMITISQTIKLQFLRNVPVTVCRKKRRIPGYAVIYKQFLR